MCVFFLLEVCETAQAAFLTALAASASGLRVNQNDETLSQNSLRYLSKVNVPMALTK